MHFSLPDREVFERISTGKNYGISMYFGRGPVCWLRRQRFQSALNIAKGVESEATIDLGCADGVLLPTLANEFGQVFAIDINEGHIKQCETLVEEFDLSNVTVLHNKNNDLSGLQSKINKQVKLMWLLETLEHVGEQPDIWGTKLEFLHDAFGLMSSEGHIVISVPKMVGFGFMLKYLTQNFLLGVHDDRMSFRNFVKSVFLGNTDELEPLWNGKHLGFNHLKLDKLLADNFEVVRRKETIISCLYVIRSKS